MVYPNLKFPKRLGRPFFYTNFVQTLDGKVAVLQNPNDYWPIGSETDHRVLLELRSHADCLIHGKNLAKEFGGVTLKSLNKPSFKKIREDLGKKPYLPYLILTGKPESLPKPLGANVIPGSHLDSRSFGTPPGGGIGELVKYLMDKSYKNVLVEGGPHLLGSFLKEDLIDEVFITISPKIFGNKNSSTLTLVEGYLFPKKSIKELTLLSVKQIGNELFLRYRIEK